MGKAQAAKKSYLVVTTVKHDGELYRNGDSIDLTEAEAEQLLDGGSIMEEKAARKQQAQQPPQPPTGDPQTPPAQ